LPDPGPPIRVASVGAAHLPSLQALFEAAASPCFCRYWHFAGNKNEWLERCAFRPEENAAELAAAIGARPEGGEGLVALSADSAADRVVGWMKLIARSRVPKLRGLPVYRSLDLGEDDGVLSVGCFLVHPDARGRGVARALVLAAPSFARAWGARWIEAYPRRSTEPLHAEEAWQGPERLFVEAGFSAVHDVAPYPVYRLRVA
jgi:GNAT superfamily N-acetyltransferase